MPIATYLAGSAASVAALLSGISLVLTRRWQQRDSLTRRQWEERDVEEERRAAARVWTLDALKQPLIDHINMSFKLGRACSSAVIAKDNGRADDRALEFRGAIDLHIAYMDEMLYLRLLGTPDLVIAAEHLHRCLDVLLDLTFAEDIASVGRTPFSRTGVPDGLTVIAARRQCMAGREALINRAREHLGLPADAVINRTI